jgi:RNA polymerase sigma-70 factor (ECF subfamily)
LATNDNVLLERVREYDDQALAEIYDCYAESIYRYLYRYLGDAYLAEDLTSEVFIKLLQALGTPRAPRDQLKGWLYRVAHNLAMDWFRQHAKDDPLPLNEELAPDSESLIDRFEEKQSQHRLRQAIRQLTSSQQQVILLRFGEGLRIKQVSQLMGKSEGSIKLIQFRAVKRLRKILEQEENRE